MAVTENDVKFYKSETITDGASNGGRMSYVEVPNNVKHNLFPRVTKSERENGVTRYRKEFWANRNASNEVAYGLLLAIITPSNGDDRFYIKPGTQVDTQGDLTDEGWLGGGKLNADAAAGATQIQVLFEADDYEIPNDRTLVITDETNTDFPKTANNQYTGENIGTGDGSQTSFSDTLEHPPVKKNSVTVHYTIGGTDYEGQDDGNGNITGTHISSGSIDYETGDISLTFDTAPDNGTAITCDYTERCYSFSGNVATINLQNQVAHDYSASNTYVGVCIEAGDIEPSHADVNVTSTNGTFDDSQMSEDNQGTVYDEWTITFSDSQNFSCSGTYEGDVGTGSITSDFSPTNPNTGKPYFTIPSGAWGGSWQAGDTVTFKTYPAAFPIWWKEVVPAGAGREENNVVELYWYIE